ncbi:MAG: beta-phosphoglucomutase [Spirochaetales bacterium]|nr:beta-phosphoglucomutase [Spirochaetales bacterium]
MERLPARIIGYLFDLDGVLADTAKYHFLAWKRLADRLDIPFTERDNERLKGVSRMASLEILLQIGGQRLSDGEKRNLAERKNTWYVEYLNELDRSALLPGAREYLDQLRRGGMKTALGSASKNAALILEKTGIADCFDAVIDGSCVSRAKPDPEVFLKGAEALSLPVEACVVFEDAPSGIGAAKRAGMYAVGVGDPLLLGEADGVIPSLASMVRR